MRELSQRVGVTPATMSKIVNRGMSPSLKTAIKILSITGDEINFLDLCSVRDIDELEQFYRNEEKDKLEVENIN